MEYSYPLLQRIFEHYDGISSKHKIANLKLYSCQHLLEPQYRMYKELIKFGFKPENIAILGKAYSSNKEIINNLRDLGISVVQPDFSGSSFDEDHVSNCKTIVAKISDKDENIILDDGGFLIYEAKDKNILFAVEQTSSGYRKIKDIVLRFPIFNVARSTIKLTKESPFIGNLICQRLKKYIFDKNILHPKILIIGLGSIGSVLLQILKKEGFNVFGFDVEKDKADMFLYLKEEKPDLVIGATGSPLFDKEDLNQLTGEHVYHFISVSSSDREFPVASFRKNTQIHCDVLDRNFVFVNNGFPVTFKGNRYESLPVDIEKTIGLLMGSIMHGSVYDMSDVRGIQEIPYELEAILE